MCRAASDNKNSVAWAMSSVVPTRPVGVQVAPSAFVVFPFVLRALGERGSRNQGVEGDPVRSQVEDQAA